jgi:branched-chain amino acid transport system permease protein
LEGKKSLRRGYRGYNGMSVTRRRERLDRGIKVRTGGIYGLLSWREMSYVLAPRAALILGLLILPLVMPSQYWQKVVCLMTMFALLALVFDFLAEFVGLISLGNSLFVGVGAYLAAILDTWLGLPVALTIPLASIGGAVVCTLFLLPCLPLRGIYFAIMTLIYPMLAGKIITALNILGGTNGIFGLKWFPNIWVEQYLIIGVGLICLFGTRRLVGQDIGLVLMAVKENDQAVRASGVRITPCKALAVFIGSSIGCFVGAYIAHLYQFAGLSLFALDFSVLPIAASIVGGLGTLAGPMLGAFILIPLSEFLRPFGGLRIAIYSFILVIFVLFRPEGLLNYAQRKYHQVERWTEV